MTIPLKIKRLVADIPLPHYAHEGDAACDIFAAESVEILPGARVSVRAGFAMELPSEYVGFIWDKSGLSHNHGLKTLGGVIDSGYRGEVKIGIINLGAEPYTVEKGHKIAQMVVQKKETVHIEEVSELSDSSRAEGGFGSTGK